MTNLPLPSSETWRESYLDTEKLRGLEGSIWEVVTTGWLLYNLQLKFTSSAWSPNHDFEVILDWWCHSLKQMRYSLRKIFILSFKKLPWLLLLLLLSHSAVSNSLWPRKLQHARLPCPSPSAWVCSCPLSNYVILCCPLLLLPSVFPSIRVFSSESTLHISWPKYWSFSFSISPSNDYSELISLRIDWFDLLTVKGTLESLLQQHSSKASVLSLLYGSSLTSIGLPW